MSIFLVNFFSYFVPSYLTKAGSARSDKIDWGVSKHKVNFNVFWSTFQMLYVVRLCFMLFYDTVKHGF